MTNPSIQFVNTDTGFFDSNDEVSITVGGSEDWSSDSLIYTNSATSLQFISYDEHYVTFRLPQSDMPKKVYCCGRLLTLGNLGADVEAVYDSDTLIIQRIQVYLAIQDKYTLSVEYNDYMYHYNLIMTYDKPEVEAKLVSQVRQ